MPSQTFIAVNSNNPDLIELLHQVKSSGEVTFVKPGHTSQFHLYLLDLSLDLADISQHLIHVIHSAQDSKAKLTLGLLFSRTVDIEKVHHFRQLLKSLYQDQPNYRLVMIKDLYQDLLDYPVTDLDKQIDRSLRESIWKTSLKAKNTYFPLFVEDLVTAITKIFFLNRTAGKTFWLFGEPMKDFEIGYLLKKILADTSPDFQVDPVYPDQSQDQEFITSANDTQIDLNWRPDTDFSLKLPGILEKFRSAAQETPDHSTNSLSKKILHRLNQTFNAKRHKEVTQSLKTGFRKTLLRTSLAILVLYLLNAGLFGWTLFRELKALDLSLDLISQNQLLRSVDEINRVESINSLTMLTYEPLKPLFQLISPRTAEELNNLFNFNIYLARSIQNLQQTYNLAEKIYQSLTDSQSALDPSEASLALQSNLSLIYENLRQIRISLDSKQLPGSVVKKITDGTQYARLENLEDQVAQAIKITDLIPTVLGASSTKIGILVQDQDELRPAGGLIKQLLVLQLDHGKLVDAKSYLPSDLDSLAEGVAQAPELLSKITGAVRYNFKDMNYPADFSQAGQYLTNYLDQVINLKLDVLVGLNKSIFEKLIAQDQAINVAGKVIKPQDLRSTSSDSDASKAVVDYYLSSLKAGDLPMSALGQAIISEIQQGNLQLYAQDEVSQGRISRLPISGTVLDHFCHPGLEQYKQCLSQTTYINEANFTFAPVNHSLKRDVVHEVTITEAGIDHEYKISYSFQTDLSQINRPYQAIYQLFAPSGTQITQIKLDGQPYGPSDLIRLDHGQLEYFQFPVAFSPTSDHQLSIAFSTTSSPIDIKTTAFSFTDIRQSGLAEAGNLLLIKIPENTRPVVISAPIQPVQGALAVRLPAKTSTFGLGLSY